MRSAFRRIDIIYKTISIFRKRIVMLKGHFHQHSVLFSLTVNNIS